MFKKVLKINTTEYSGQLGTLGMGHCTAQRMQKTAINVPEVHPFACTFV